MPLRDNRGLLQTRSTSEEHGEALDTGEEPSLVVEGGGTQVPGLAPLPLKVLRWKDL